MDSNDLIRQQFTEASDLLHKILEDEQFIDQIQKAAELCIHSLRSEGKIISCGNGGSMSDAMHFAEELSGRFREDRPSLAAISISDPSHITCTANDYGFDQIFSRFVEGLGKKGDVLLAISTSGNSANVVKAAQAAKAKAMKVIVLTGKDGGKLASLADVEIRVPHAGYADRIQEVHIKVIHCMIQLIEQGFPTS